MLQELLGVVNKDKIFVLELSSSQLEDLDISPNISVVTNLFPEHMDYHGTLENYYKAKKNIINFQNNAKLRCYSINYNILRIANGLCGLVFSN